MKFTVRTSLQKSSARLGELHNIRGKSTNLTLETPLALLHTQGGQIPHITHEVLKLISQEPHILQIPLVSMHNYCDTIKFYNGTLPEFIGSKHSLICITFNDPSNLTKQGDHHARRDKVPLFTKNGKILYDSEMYMKIIEKFQPDMCILLADSDTNIASPKKRILKSVDNTLMFIQQSMDIYKKQRTDFNKDTFIIAPIEGGYCLKSREKFINELFEKMEYSAELFDGYLIDGLHNNGPEVELIEFKEIEPIIRTVVQKTPIEKLRIIQGCWSPLNIIKLVKCGIDLFDTSYCRILTERSAALTFLMDYNNDNNKNYEINLRNLKFADDFQQGLLKNCECLTCTGYTRAYIHHLLTVQELLGSILIMIHNIHHMLKFFEKIRYSIKFDKLDQLEELITLQYNNNNNEKNSVHIL